MTGPENQQTIGKDCYIHPTAVLVGRFQLMDRSSIWAFAVVRGDEEPIIIGSRSNVQDGVIIHTDEGFPVRVGNEVTIGHGAVIHGCEIGDRCIIGIRSVILNGSRIGKGSIIGAGAVVTPGTEIPPYSMVLGIPGKVKKTDSSFEASAVENADIYVELASKHMKGGFPNYRV
ncbi:MAG: gamma carbonic anhydrase family protein [Thermoplasmatota archaeon]